MATEILTPDEMAARMRVGRQTVIDWARRGVIPCLRPSTRVIRFDPEAVAKALTVPVQEGAPCPS